MRLDTITQTESTNSLLRKWIIERRSLNLEVFSPWAIAADFQTAGRGAGENKWYSSRGKNILTSIFFEPKIHAPQQFVFNIFFSVASRDLIAEQLPDVKIKWPNDIFVNNKKIAGILIEHSVKGSNLDFSIAGIGININEDSFPKEIPNPTSLLLENKNCDCKKVLNRFLNILDERFPLLASHSKESLQNEYLKNLYRLDEKHYFIYKNKTFQGIIRGIDEFGRLLVEDCSNNNINSYEYKQISYVI